MAGLIAQLLDAASLRMGKLTLQRERIDLAALVSDIAATLQPTTRNYRLVVLAEGPIPVDADRLRLEQVLTNLVDNAVKYAGYGDRIEIEAAALPDRTARVAVRDYGVGIPPELRDKVFDRYQQGRQGGLVGGLGIGLYVARQIVELHGGAIAIECPPDGGTRFSIALPSEPGESTAAPPPGLAPVRPFSRPTLAGPDAEAAHTSRPARRMNGAA